MLRNYEFNWYPTKDAKYGKSPVVRSNMVELTNPLGKTEIDAKMALAIFTKRFGNLNKNTIVSIKEFGEDGQIGEDIIPAEENSIIPSGK